MAKIREHSPPVAGWCMHCKQRQVDGVWPSPCVEREDWLKPRPGSEPKPRSYACEAADIPSLIEKIRREEAPKCPRAVHKTLHDCLRESARCPGDCPYFGDWIGPQKD